MKKIQKQVVLFGLIVIIIMSLASLTYARTSISAPLAPRNIQIQEKDNAILITWEKPLTKNYTGFRIYRSEKEGKLGKLIKKINKNIFFFLDSNIKKNITYFYTVRTVRNSRISNNKKQVFLKIIKSISKPVSNPKSAEPQHTYTMYETTNKKEGFGFIDKESDYYKEKFSTIIAVERENVKVLVPNGYELLAKANIEDLINCKQLLSKFFGGISFPKDKTVMKIYVSTDGSNLGSSVSGKIIYKRSQKNIDSDLHDVETNNSEGFLYNSNKNYCSNSHELTHAFFSGSPFPSWGNEGLAQFTQKYNQKPMFDYINCKNNGYYSEDKWNNYSDMSNDNVLDYNTAMCLMNELVDTYGWDDFYSMLARLNKFQTGELIWEKEATYHFVKDVLEYVYGNKVLDILKKYGIEKKDYSI